jgi:hypothetical protein
MEALYEIQAAELLGFRRMVDFRRAVRRGEVPGPDRKVGRDPVWSRAKLQAWLDGDEHTLSIAKQRDEALRRAAGG